MILAGDVGGTKVDLALYEFASGKLKLLYEQKYPAPKYVGLEAVVREFIDTCALDRTIAAASFGVPGPVRAGKLRLTNLPWNLDSHELSRNLKIEHVFLINDLEANGYGIPELTPEQIYTLSEGDPAAAGNCALVSAGTGLGEAILAWNGKTHTPMASEGGHCDFAARNEIEIALLRYLQRELNGRVSWERVVSGIGLKNIYAFLRDAEKMEEPAWLSDRMIEEDPNAVIGECGENGTSDLCRKTLEIFVSAYGAEAGNLALKALSNGGIYLGGGIAPKILKTLKNGMFMQAFVDKGRLGNLLQQMPVHVLLESQTALIGAAAYAEARAAEFSGRSERTASVRQH
jgi:glucokinase